MITIVKLLSGRY